MAIISTSSNIHAIHNRVYSFLSNTIVLLANAIKIIRFTESIHSVYTIIVFVCLAACLWHNEVLCSIFYTPLHIVTFAFIITYQVSAHIAMRSRKWSEPTQLYAEVAYTSAVNAITRLFKSHICTYTFHCFLEPPGFFVDRHFPRTFFYYYAKYSSQTIAFIHIWWHKSSSYSKIMFLVFFVAKWLEATKRF